MTWLYIWLGVVVASLILEFVTMELVSIWISLGSLVAMILAIPSFKIGFEIQIIVAIAISIVCILFLRKVTLKFFNKNKEKTNLDLIIGAKTKLLTAITKDSMGSLKHNGIEYSAITENFDEINAGEFVIIEKIQGNKLVVKKEN